MMDNELILLFKKDSEMNEKEWKKFCKRYTGKDKSVVPVAEFVKAVYRPKGVKVSGTITRSIGVIVRKK